MTLGISMPSYNGLYNPWYFPNYQFPSYQWPVSCPSCGHCPTCGNRRPLTWIVSTITADTTLDLNVSANDVTIYNGATPPENECQFGDACAHD